MEKANLDIRAMMKEKGVPVYAVASVMGIHDNTLFRRLRYELSDKDKQAFKRIINELSEQNASANN